MASYKKMIEMFEKQEIDYKFTDSPRRPVCFMFSLSDASDEVRRIVKQYIQEGDVFLWRDHTEYNKCQYYKIVKCDSLDASCNAPNGMICSSICKWRKACLDNCKTHMMKQIEDTDVMVLVSEDEVEAEKEKQDKAKIAEMNSDQETKVRYLREMTDKWYIYSFDKVLVRNSDHDLWKCDFFSHLEEINGNIVAVCIGGKYNQCISALKNREGLVICGRTGIAGTNKPADPCDIWWNTKDL